MIDNGKKFPADDDLTGDEISAFIKPIYDEMRRRLRSDLAMMDREIGERDRRPGFIRAGPRAVRRPRP